MSMPAGRTRRHTSPVWSDRRSRFPMSRSISAARPIVENISLDVKPGEFLCIIGASGCGKTTALRLAAGLYQPTSGAVTFDGKPMLTPRRDIAVVFQDYSKALLPWRTAAGTMSRWRWRR